MNRVRVHARHATSAGTGAGQLRTLLAFVNGAKRSARRIRQRDANTHRTEGEPARRLGPLSRAATSIDTPSSQVRSLLVEQPGKVSVNHN